jgi:hypothetical protein
MLPTLWAVASLRNIAFLRPHFLLLLDPSTLLAKQLVVKNLADHGRACDVLSILLLVQTRLRVHRKCSCFRLIAIWPGKPLHKIILIIPRQWYCFWKLWQSATLVYCQKIRAILQLHSFSAVYQMLYFGVIENNGPRNLLAKDLPPLMSDPRSKSCLGVGSFCHLSGKPTPF